jgi:ferric-dicitrate binding protein FerR (iron transport regulator)
MGNQNDIQKIVQETEKLFSVAKVNWSKSKELVFQEKFAKLADEPKTKVLWPREWVLQFSVAASVLLVIGLGAFALLYTKTIYTSSDQHLTAQLPDGSTVEMNAETTLRFHPYSWFYQRKIAFEGEGFFSVKKGRKFTVESSLGKTQVMGTSFNIFARDNAYRVFCKTGKVRVSNNANGSSVLLMPNQKTIIFDGTLSAPVFVVEPENILSWRNYIFSFDATPFNEVIKEIERQYGVSITSQEPITNTISVSFQKVPDVEKTLSIICKPLGYRFVRKSLDHYEILKNN